MLTHLSVRNVVLIDRLDLDFSDGLTVFTGETGAGKSILLDALSLALGMRAEAQLVRHGEKEAAVTACFTLPSSHPIGELLTEHGYDFAGEVILRRQVSADGRSRAFVNDEPVSVAFLKTLGDQLVEIHGQFASHRLLNPATHLETLDAYGNLSAFRDTCRQAYRDWQSCREACDRAEADFLQAQNEETFLRDSVESLIRLNPQPDEEETLTARRTQLMNSEKIVTALNATTSILSDENAGCLTLLGRALSELEHADSWAQSHLQPAVAQLSEALSLIEDTVATCEKEAENWGDVSALPEIDERLFALRDMARKHQTTIAELPALRTRLEEALSHLEQGETLLDQLRQKEHESRKTYLSAAQQLSEARHLAAQQLDKAVAQELPALKLNKASFHTAVEDLPESDWSERGTDRVSFLVATNTGTPLAPIHKIASGGELARFMLALKVNLATTDAVETLIFDEVDTGIGGATAAAVGARLKELGNHHQVLVVTHSPQVAAYGQNHASVHKQEQDQHVITTVTLLDTPARQQELARMLSGEAITATARTMAEELLHTAATGAISNPPK